MGKSFDDFRNDFVKLFLSAPLLTEKQEVAFELFCSSFFDVSPRSRIVTLVSAVEALVELRPRESKCKELVEKMVTLCKGAKIDEQDRQSLLSSLQWLHNESIGQAARALVKKLLGDREFGGMPVDRFFTHVYSLRSDIVHRGTSSKMPLDLGSIYSELRRMVSELLSAAAREP